MSVTRSEVKPDVCPKCGQDDLYIAVWRRYQGNLIECADCGETFPEENDGE